jgi:hypothetical protein
MYQPERTNPASCSDVCHCTSFATFTNQVTKLVTVIAFHIRFRSVEIVAFPLIPRTSTTFLAIRSPESTSSASSTLAATNEVCAINGNFVVKMLGFVSDFDFGVEFGGFHGMDSCKVRASQTVFSMFLGF